MVRYEYCVETTVQSEPHFMPLLSEKAAEGWRLCGLACYASRAFKDSVETVAIFERPVQPEPNYPFTEVRSRPFGSEKTLFCVGCDRPIGSGKNLYYRGHVGPYHYGCLPKGVTD